MSNEEIALYGSAALPFVFDPEGSPWDVASDLGLVNKRGVESGIIPFILHDSMLGRATDDVFEKIATESFTVGELEFNWLLSSTAPDGWKEVGLSGHRLITPSQELRTRVQASILHLARREYALGLVGKYITTFALVECLDLSKMNRITSCSLPDYPLCVFFSERIFEHIPPSSVGRPSIRLGAENIFHEAVHQSVNHLILTEGIFHQDYDAATSPRVPIFWRKDAREDRNKEWEIDRVLHAAAVYSHLLQWRYYELLDESLTADERNIITTAAVESIDAVRSLSSGLVKHIEFFTPKGALFVGRLVESIGARSVVLELVINDSRITTKQVY